MSNEISYKANLQIDANNHRASQKNETDFISPSSPRFVQSSIVLTTVPESIPIGDLATVGIGSFRNASSTNTIQLLNGLTGDVMDILPPGETHLFRPGTNTPAAKALANTATLQYLICEQ